MNKKYVFGAGFLAVILLFFYCKGPSVNNWEITKPQTPFTQIIFFGDSLTSGYGLKDNELSFPEQVGKELNLPFKIFGYPGKTTEDGLSKVTNLKDETPSLVILTLGGNDILRRKKLSETESNLNKIIDTLQNWGHTVVFTEVLSIMDGKRQHMYASLCETKKICIVPDILKGMITDQKSMQADSIHPNEQGCAIIAERIIKVLKENKFFD